MLGIALVYLGYWEGWSEERRLVGAACAQWQVVVGAVKLAIVISCYYM